MKRFFILLIGLLSINFYSKACVCAEDSIDWSLDKVYKNIKKSDLIFIGELVNPQLGAYRFKLINIFKGEFLSDTISGIGKTTCDAYPHKKGLWIVYANWEGPFIKFSSCDKLSRNISELSHWTYMPLNSSFSINDSNIRLNTIIHNEYLLHLNNLSQELLILDSLKQRDKKGNNIFIIVNLCILVFNIFLLILILNLRKRKK